MGSRGVQLVMIAALLTLPACSGSSAPSTAVSHPPRTTITTVAPSAQPGELLLRLTYPRLHVNVGVVEGTSSAAMQAGVGHYRQTPLPGRTGNSVILGDPTFYGRPFARLSQAKPGDTVTVTIRGGRDYRYRVVGSFAGHRNPWMLPPDDRSYLSQSGPLARGAWLTLVTLPRGSSERVVLRLKLST